jgi:glycosyltransferase involved in cell wall biosynthesis
VIIPTYNRKDILAECLEALFRQTYSETDWEIIVIDDGSTDGTRRAVEELAASAPVPVTYNSQDHRGPAAARNRGIRLAKGEIVLIIGDDIIASPRLIEEHTAYHREYGEESTSVLGLVTWYEGTDVTPFMRWLDSGGPYFHYWQIEGKREVDYRYFYTCNISVKRDFLLENGLFDEDFPSAAWEDIELGYRLERKGHRILYNPAAVAFHHHQLSLDGVCRRAILIGESSRILHQKAPELAPEHRPLRRRLKDLFISRHSAAVVKTLAEATGSLKLADWAIRAYRHLGFRSRA